MDQVDRKLINQMQIDSRTPIAALAEIANSSPASVQRRLKRLREDRVIQREVAILDPVAAGYAMTCIISVEVERDRLDKLDAFKRRARDEPQVQQCYCVAGEADFILIAVVRDMKDYETFTHRFFLNDTNVRRFRTSVVVSPEKTTLTVPIDIE